MDRIELIHLLTSDSNTGTEAYPVDFDVLWELCSYSNKGLACILLYKLFDEDTDYRKNGKNITVTKDTAIQIAMMSKSAFGKLIRAKYINWGNQNKEVFLEYISTHLEENEAFKLLNTLFDIKANPAAG